MAANRKIDSYTRVNPTEGDSAIGNRGTDTLRFALGSAAKDATTDFATAAQGLLAASATQPEDLGTAAAADVQTSLTDATANRLVQIQYAVAAPLYAFGSYYGLTASENIDNAVAGDVGLYSSVNPGTFPTSSASFYWITTQKQYINTALIQTATTYNISGTAAPRQFVRIKANNGDPWSDWKELYSGTASDTAWTTVTSLSNGWTGTVKYIKRAGMVTIILEALDGSSITNIALLTMPTVYRPSTQVRSVASDFSSTPDEIAIITMPTDGLLQVSGSGGDGTAIYGQITYPVI